MSDRRAAIVEALMQGERPDHARLYMAREDAPADMQAQLAALEHEAFAREWTKENPFVAAPSLAAAIPLYTVAKALGMTRARSPASLDEMAAGYRGIWQGLTSK